MSKKTEYKKSEVSCACGEKFETMSTKENIHVEVCDKCHPFYTGAQKRGSKTGKIEKFNQKYNL
jgi:large subunit ribosomal protein L31